MKYMSSCESTPKACFFFRDISGRGKGPEWVYGESTPKACFFFRDRVEGAVLGTPFLLQPYLALLPPGTR